MSQPEHRPAEWSYRPELDGIRTFAVLVIIFYHAGTGGWANAFIALDLFFVLSGFLVTNVIMSEIHAKGRLGLGGYYARRVRRLLPAAVLVVVVTCVIFVLVASQPERAGFIRQAQAALVYLANWQFIAESHDYFAADVDRSPFMHFWSLSIEEQYYIFFPLVIVAVLAWSRRCDEGSWMRTHWTRVLMIVLMAITALSLVSQIISAAHDPIRAYFATDARLYQLMIGGVVAIALREFAGRWRTREGHVAWPRAGLWLATAALAGFMAFGSPLIDMTVSHRGMVATVLSLALVVGLYTAAGSVLGWLFSRPVPVFLGKISYGTYLFHYPMILVVEQLFDVRAAVVAVIAGTLATALAALSYQVYETPIRRAKVLNGLNWHTVVTGLGVSVLAAALVVGPILNSDRRPVVPMAVADGSAASALDGDWLQRPVPDLDFEAAKESKGPAQRWCLPDNAQECVMTEGSGPPLMLIGDSHARMLAAAFNRLAEEKDFTFSTNIVLACPWHIGILNTTAPPARMEACEESRSTMTETVKALDVDVVVLAQLARGDLEEWEGNLVDYDREPVPIEEMQFAATESTVAELQSTGAEVVVVKSLMGTVGFEKNGWNPLNCLASAQVLGDCAVIPSFTKPLVDGYYDAIAAREENVRTLDLNPVICPNGRFCAPVRDGRIVWRDRTHLTADFVRYVREDIWSALEGTGALGTG